MVGDLHCGKLREGTRILEIQAKQLVLSLILGLEQLGGNSSKSLNHIIRPFR
jgi:hypothetical protein